MLSVLVPQLITVLFIGFVQLDLEHLLKQIIFELIFRQASALLNIGVLVYLIGSDSINQSSPECNQGFPIHQRGFIFKVAEGMRGQLDMSSLEVAGKARFKLIQNAFEDDPVFGTKQVIFADAGVVLVLNEWGASHIVLNEFMLHFQLFIASGLWLGVGKHYS